MTDHRNRVHSIPLEILDDLGSRFIINIPEAERKDLIRICFQIELAHWFYLDEYVSEANKNLRPCNIREFAVHMFNHIKFLKKHAPVVEEILDSWRDYKLSVPTYGAIILNEDLTQFLLVQSYWSKSSWSFPKGKVNEEEKGHDCAVREVFEETGFDIGPFINPKDFMEAVVNDQTIRLYPIPGVPTDTIFKPRTKCEIRDVQWFPIDGLPLSKKGIMPENHLKIGVNNLFMVWPFARSLRKWINKQHWKKRGPATSSVNVIQVPHVAHAAHVAHGESKKKPQGPPIVPESVHFLPTAWSSFQLDTQALLFSLSSVPGWIH